jgi:hypothetical protein
MMGIYPDMDEHMILALSNAIFGTYKKIKQVAEPILLESVFQTNIACIKIYDFAKRCRKGLPVIDSHISQIEKGVFSAYSHIHQFLRYFVYKAVELNYYPWISVTRYYRTDTRSSYVRGRSNNTPVVEDVYSNPSEPTFAEAFSHVYRSIDPSNSTNQTLITMAMGPGSRIIALWNPDRADFVPTMEKSKIDFILVEYGHPKMKGLMQINLPDSVYMVGNEILSKSFVLRYLNHSCIPNTWVFDEDYIVRIMDHNADSIEIGSRQYIVLEKEGYRVVEDEYADLPDLIPVDSIEQFMCESDSENESPAGYISEEEEELEEELDEEEHEKQEENDLELKREPENPQTKRTYSIEDAVFVLDDFADDGYAHSNKIEPFNTKPKQD